MSVDWLGDLLVRCGVVGVENGWKICEQRSGLANSRARVRVREGGIRPGLVANKARKNAVRKFRKLRTAWAEAAKAGRRYRGLICCLRPVPGKSLWPINRCQWSVVTHTMMTTK